MGRDRQSVLVRTSRAIYLCFVLACCGRAMGQVAPESARRVATPSDDRRADDELGRWFDGLDCPGGTDGQPLPVPGLLPTVRPAGSAFSQMVLIAWDGAQMAHSLEMMQRGALPNLRRLVEKGGFAPTWVTGHCTGTLAGFAEMLTGYGPETTGAYGFYRCRPIPRELTVFYRLKHHFSGNIATVVIAGKGPRLHSTPGGPWHEARADIDVWHGDKPRDHNEVGGLAVDWLRAHAEPGARFFCFIHFREPDLQGHVFGENSAEYEAALADLDGWLGRIRRTLVACGVASTTAVCVATDHGFDEGSTHHSHAPDAWLAANWTPLLPGDQRDVAPTLLAAYEIDPAEFTPSLPGRPLWEPPRPAPPVLRWAGLPGFRTDGIEPNAGGPVESITKFCVRLCDRDGDEPAWVRVAIRKDGSLWRTLDMRGDTCTTMAGRIYSRQLRTPLPPGRYSYRYRARDDDGLADGPASRREPGPSMLPELAFVRTRGLTDGVDPDCGTACHTRFVWRVLYRDNDGDPAQVVQVRLWRDGQPFGTLQMAAAEPALDPMGAVVYECCRRMPAGEYEHRFEAEDKDGWAAGLPSRRMPGLVATQAVPLALTSLSTVPTNTGTHITFGLSASAQVQARILNIAGRPVRTLCHAKHCETGTTTLLWNAQTDTGLRVPDGTYLVEVMVKAGDGTQARSLTQVRLAS